MPLLEEYQVEVLLVGRVPCEIFDEGFVEAVMPLRPVVRIIDAEDRLGAPQKSRSEVNGNIIGLCTDLMRICPDATQGKTATRGTTIGKEVDQGLGLGGECSSEFGTIDAEDLLLPMYLIEGPVEVTELIP